MNGAQRKYIHVIRDPRDAALSWVHYHGTTEPDVVDQVWRSAGQIRGRCEHAGSSKACLVFCRRSSRHVTTTLPGQLSITTGRWRRMVLFTRPWSCSTASGAPSHAPMFRRSSCAELCIVPRLMDDTFTQYVKVLKWFGLRASKATITKVIITAMELP